MHSRLDKYPAVPAAHGRRGHRLQRCDLPTAIGTGPLADPPAIEGECRDFCVAAPDEVGSGCIEPFLTVPFPEAGRA